LRCFVLSVVAVYQLGAASHHCYTLSNVCLDTLSLQMNCGHVGLYPVKKGMKKNKYDTIWNNLIYYEFSVRFKGEKNLLVYIMGQKKIDAEKILWACVGGCVIWEECIVVSLKVWEFFFENYCLGI